MRRQMRPAFSVWPPLISAWSTDAIWSARGVRQASEAGSFDEHHYLDRRLRLGQAHFKTVFNGAASVSRLSSLVSGSTALVPSAGGTAAERTAQASLL